MLTSCRGQLQLQLALKNLRRIPPVFLRAKSRFVHPDGVNAYEDDFLPEAIYPSIDPVWNRRSAAHQQRYQEYKAWQKSIRDATTVEWKGVELNMPHRYGYYCFMLTEDVIQYDSLPFHQYISRTHLMPQTEFPDPYSSPELKEKVRHFADKLSGPLLEVLKFEFDGIIRRRKEDEKPHVTVQKDTESVVNQVSRLILQVLSSEDSYFQNIQVDYTPKSEAFWMVGGFARSKLRKKRLANRVEASIKYKQCLVKETDPVELNFQHIGSPILQIRSEFPVGTLIDEENLEEINKDEPAKCRFDYSPQDFYSYKKLRHATNVSGHWSCDPAKCNLLSFHSPHHLTYGTESQTKSPAYAARTPILLQSQAVLVSFTKLLAQAYALGYDQFSPLSQPLTSQSVITNGRDWSFAAYQLNTLQLDKWTIDENKEQNICWTTPSMSILDSDGKLNQSVLDTLLKFYLLPTLAERKRPEMPYLKCTSLDDLPNDEERTIVQCNYSRIYSQIELVLDPMPELYLWEKIYKVDHQTRPMEPRRRFFEIPGENPYYEKYRIHNPFYKPKMLKKMEAALAAKKEQEKLEAVKAAQKAKFHQYDDTEED